MVASKLEYYEQLLGQNMESFLIEQYLKYGNSAKEISKGSGIPLSTVERYMRKFNVPKLSKAELFELKQRNLSDKLCAYCGSKIPKYREDKDTCSHVCARRQGELDRHNEANKQTYYCELCGEVVPGDRKSKRFCSNYCAVRYGHLQQGHGTQLIICHYCGAEIEVKKSVIEKGGGIYCCKECHDMDMMDTTTFEDVKVAALEYYDKYEVCATKEGLAAYMGTTKKVVENRIGSLINFYNDLGIWAEGSTLKGRGARALFTMIDAIYNVQGVLEKTFPDLRNPKTRHNLFLDYYLEEYNLAVEYQGEFHYKSFKEGKLPLRQIQRDDVKRNYCASHGITLIEWVYTVPVIEQNVHLYFDKLLAC